MATIDPFGTMLRVRTAGAKPRVYEDIFIPDSYRFESPTFELFASARLKGEKSEPVGGWTLGFVQLKFIGTNHARYRVAHVGDGSVLVSRSNQILCRDTMPGSREVWYDSPSAHGIVGPDGTNKLAAGTRLPLTGSLTVRAHLFDQPFRAWPYLRPNALAGGQPNYLHYVVIELLFCTMLVAQDPAGRRQVLKHVYWNVIWEQVFRRNRAGDVVPDRAIRLQQNVQHPVQDGEPHDRRFTGRVFDLSLPISNIVSNRPPRVLEVRNWSQG